MNTAILERLRGFRIPAVVPLPSDRHYVARLTGIDFEGLLASPDLGLAAPYDAGFAKLMVRTLSHLLGGDACGRFGHAEHTEFSVLFDRRQLAERWADANKLQNFLVGLASTKLSKLVDTEAIFACELFAFNSPDVAISYFVWRQQEADLATLDLYCSHVLAKDNDREQVRKLLEGMGPNEKEEILRQHEIEYTEVPGWQRRGTGVRLAPDGGVAIDPNLPTEAAFVNLLKQLID